MSETIETIEIAKAIKAGLDTAFAGAYPVYAAGVPTDEDGNIDESATTNEHKLPSVDILIRECMPMGHRSVMREYPGRISVVTHFGSDPFQAEVATMARAVNIWLATPPSITLTLRKCDAITIDASPEVGVEGQLQYATWDITVHTGPANT